MIFLQNMDRMGFIMKTKECMNCGSTQFHQVKDGWKCEYCGTLYLNEKKTRKTTQVEAPPITQKKRNVSHNRAAIPIVIMLMGLLSYTLIKISNESATAYTPNEPVIEKNSAKAEFPGGWTQEIYDSVKVATKNYDADTGEYSFENGANYEEVEKLVGKPETVTSWEKGSYGMPARSMATWNKTSEGEYAPQSVTITYENDTMMITDKNHY